MKQFKKRTIALVLASAVAVAGSFGAENYKNSLMLLNFSFGNDGSVNMTLHTQKAYEGNLTPVRKDADTYVLMLPEVNSEAPTPDIKDVSGNIESVNIRTMPYTNGGKGYTKITIKTGGSTILSAENKIFVPAEAPEPLLEDNAVNETPAVEQETVKQQVSRPSTDSAYAQRHARRTQNKQVQPESNEPAVKREVPPETNEIKPESKKSVEEKKETPAPPKTSVPGKDPTETILLLLGILFIVAASVFFYIKAKNKLIEIAGEQLDIKLDDEDSGKKKKSSKVKKLKNTIKTLDSKYPNPPTGLTGVYASAGRINPDESAGEEEQEEINVIDLDKLYQEKIEEKNSLPPDENAENEALDEFLKAFSFDEISDEEAENNQDGYNKELYEKIINDENIKFTADDLEKISKLTDSEIGESTLKNISEFVPKSQEKKPSNQEILEKLLAEYAISQNIIFTSEDVLALYKIISVEIDHDFLSDLRTNPVRAKEMELEIERHKDTPHLISEIPILNVKGMLPNLLLELNKETSDTPPVFEEIQYSDSRYEGDKLNTSGMLPDLQDVLAHPEKYEEPEPERTAADEETMLKNIMNVSIKPFDDGTRKFEVINDFDDMNPATLSDIQKELGEFANFEILKKDEPEPKAEVQENNYDDFEALYRNKYIDLDKKIAEENAPVPEPGIKTNLRADKIQLQKISRRTNKKCIINGEKCLIISTVNIDENKGCHLIKNESGYLIIGYVGKKFTKIKHYETLKSERMQIRINEQIDEKNTRYTVKIGLNRFIVNVNDNSIKYVTDL